MPLVGYMKTTEPGRISSITTVDGDKNRRKQIRPMATGMKDPVYAMYVHDCLVHEHGGVVVPVMLKRLVQGWGWEELGIAKCCPLCWRVITPPVGVGLPPVVEQAEFNVLVTDANAKAKQQTTKPERDPGVPHGFAIQKQITEILHVAGKMTVYEIMASLGCSKPTALRHLDRMIKLKKVVKEQSPGGGGNKSYYSLP